MFYVYFVIPLILSLMSAGNPEERGIEAMWYTQLGFNNVRCDLCPRKCIITDGGRGFCRVRENQDGTLYSLVYGKPASVNIGPIEKAPLYHFNPGHRRLTLATVGCNLKCKHCHNWHISQSSPEQIRYQSLTPEEVVERAKRLGVNSISFTYTEPTIFYEYMYDIATLAREQGIRTSMVSNGYISPEPLKKLVRVLDAVKIDLKAFTEQFYSEICGGQLAPVKKTLQVLREEGVFFEIVNLVIPTLNDDPREIEKMCLWIRDNLGDDIPIHFSRFHPSYRLTRLPATPVETLEMAVKIAQRVGLKYVYIGNVPGHRYNSTFCPGCNERLIHRVHFSVLDNNVVNGACRFCGYKLPGIWR
ncbi:MAG TPA: AmmeMemoRadiSam system radical SAM enzyme [Bacteroidales bacterium]|nr:AmmeMemoRadiSam system radical SAM enzyme [Bacteroidales bacterium]